MSYLQRAAGAAPNALLFSPRFWYVNHNLVLVAVCGLALMAVLHGLTYPRTETGAGSLALLIHGLALWGLILSVRTAAKIEVDDALARRVEFSATQLLGKIKGHLIDHVEPERLEALIPDNTHWDQGVIKLCQTILDEARDRKYHPPDTLTQPIRERSVGQLFHLQTLQRIALQLGILGTFIGLVWAIFQVKESVAGALDPTVLEELIQALHLAFGTSIAGLEVSVILGLALMAVRRRQERFFGNLESAAAAFTQLARKMEITDEYLVEFEQIRHSMGAMNERLKGQALVVKNQTAEIKSGLERLAELRLQFNEFLEDVRGEQAHVLTEMKSVYEIISPEKTAKALEASLTKSIERIAGRFQEDLQAGLAELDRYNESLAELRKAITEARDQGREQAAHLEQGRETLKETSRQLVSMLDRTAKAHGDMLERLDETSKLDVESLLGDLREILEQADQAAQERWSENVASVQQRFDDQKRVLLQGNNLLRKLVARPSFFDAVIVRPAQALRHYFARDRA